MKDRSPIRKQLPLTLASRESVLTLPSSVEQPLVTALAELLVAVAVDEAAKEGGRDERKDP